MIPYLTQVSSPNSARSVPVYWFWFSFVIVQIVDASLNKFSIEDLHNLGFDYYRCMFAQFHTSPRTVQVEYNSINNRPLRSPGPWLAGQRISRETGLNWRPSMASALGVCGFSIFAIRPHRLRPGSSACGRSSSQSAGSPMAMSVIVSSKRSLWIV